MKITRFFYFNHTQNAHYLNENINNIETQHFMKIYIIYLKTNLFLYILPFPKNNLLQILLVPTARTWTSWKYKYNLFTFVINNVLCSSEQDFISTESQLNLV